MIDWMKYRFLYFGISALVVGAGVFSLIRWGLVFGIDFKGGTLLEYKVTRDISEKALSNKISKQEITVSSIQKTGDKTYLLKLGPIDQNQKAEVEKILTEELGTKPDELRFETVGPTIGPELVKKTIFALSISSITILLWVAYQFRSIKFGASAILAMFHDTLVVIGMYSIFGHFWHVEADFLFVTALLTILSFSVHDTIVVYDRMRESQKKFGGNLYDLANQATTETMVRSLNNSFTILFMLIALMILGGSTIRWFAATLFVGTVSGTYSSPFVAVPILVTWDEIEKKLKRRLT